MPDPRETLVRKMVAEGTSDEDIRATLRVFDAQHSGMGGVGRKAEAIASGIGKGATDFVGGYENWRDAIPAIGDIAKNIHSGAQSVGGALKDMGKGSLDAARALDQVLTPETFRSVSKAKDTLHALDPGKDTADPWEAWARRGTNVAGMLLGSKWGAKVSPELQAAAKGAKASVPKSMAAVSKTALEAPKGEIPAIPVRHSVEVPAEAQLPKPEVTGTSMATPGVEQTVLRPRSTSTGTYPLIRSAVPAFPENVSKIGPGMADRPALEADVRTQVKGGVKKEVAPEPASMAELPPKSLGAAAADDFGPPHGKTLSLAEMKAKYGAEGAAQRAGMDVDELEARIAAGGDNTKLLSELRGKLGADRTARKLGISADEVREQAGGPSRLPSKAVEAIKAADARYKATGETPPPKHAALMARIKNEGGAVDKKLLGTMAAGGVGAAAAPFLLGGGEGDPDAPLGKALLGGAAGLTLGTALTHPRQAMNGRAQLFLTGGAIPKNIAAGMGNIGRAIGEGSATSRLAPLKEALRLPTNVRTYIDALKGPEAFHGTLEKGFEPFESANQSKLRYIKPTQHIGAIDKTAMDTLRRAGVGEEDIQRYFLTKDRNVFKEITKHMGDLEGPAKTITRITHPFQRIPTNVVAEGVGDVAHVYKRIISRQGIDGRTAMTLASIGGGELLGQWAGNDPKRMWLASIALAAAGPSTALATMGAIHGAHKSGLGSGAFGGLSPIADIGFDIGNQTRPKNWFGFKPAAVTALEKLKGK